MEIRKVKIDDIKAAEYNPRKIEDENYAQLRDSLIQQGYVQPLVWNETTGNLVAGHQRLKILKELGFEEIDVSVVSLDIGQEKTLNLRLNQPAGQWDLIKLREMFLGVDQENLHLTGFKEEEVDQLKLFGVDSDLPKINLQGKLPVKADFITVLFDSQQEYEQVKAELNMKKNQRVINFKQLERWAKNESEI